MSLKKLKAKDITFLALMIALNVIFAEVIKIPAIPGILEFSLGFLPLAACGMLFGVVPTAIVAVISDSLGALIFYPAYFFIGYTLTALVTGILYGYFMHKPAVKKGTLCLCQALVSLICYAGLNTLWAVLLYGKTTEFILTRLLVQLPAYPLYLVCLFMLQRYRRVLEGAMR